MYSVTECIKEAVMDNQTQKPLHLVGIGAHLDDCWLGFGGTALKARRRGHRVTFIVAVTNFRKLEYLAGRDQEIMAFLNKQTETTGVEFIFLKHDYMRLVNSPELIDELVQILAKLRPDIVFCHDENECNQDHTALGGASHVAVLHAGCFLPHDIQPLYLSGEIYKYSTGWQSMGFQPDTYVDISETIFDLMNICSSVDKMYAQGKYPTEQLTVTDHTLENKTVALTGHARYKFGQAIVAGAHGYGEAFRSYNRIPIEHRKLARI
jgi:LmbE family N-acetylglucosaminyl deacetylase